MSRQFWRGATFPFFLENYAMSTQNTRGGSHEQHVKAGEQSHKNTGSSSGSSNQSQSAGSRGGSHEQHVKAGQQSHKNTK
jgi:hypothetical protein